MGLEDDTHTFDDVRHRPPRPWRIAALAVAWLLIAGGLAAWALVFPQALRGYEGFGVEKGIVTLWICVYGLAAGVGTMVLLGANTTNKTFSRTAVGVYSALLALVIVSALFGSK